MKRIRHASEQIIRKLKTAGQFIVQGKTIASVCDVAEVIRPSDHCWEGPSVGLQSEESERLTQLKSANACLK